MWVLARLYEINVTVFGQDANHLYNIYFCVMGRRTVLFTVQGSRGRRLLIKAYG